ncbi:uncharacterized protein LOC133182745 [Saccostrea echinata]|uniref:uncharacterized protein LOC133182745 n=1 Tax=Saccostrea echinata TaxID=191078 RepID=UPI002A7F6BDD|nr:uncharacterized protein LOC133182745 [Saccostrea echinata]
MEVRLTVLILLLSTNVFAQIPSQPVFQSTQPLQTFQAQGVPFQGVQASPNQISYTPFQMVPFPPAAGSAQQPVSTGPQPQAALGSQLQPMQQLPGNNLQQNSQQIQIQGTTFQAAPGTSLQPFQRDQATQQQQLSSIQQTNSNSDVQKTIQNTVQQAQQITQNSQTQNSGTDSNVGSADTSINGSIIRFNGKVFIADINGQMIEAPTLEHLVGQQIVNGQIITQDSSLMAAQQNNLASTNALLPPRMPINGMNPVNNMMFPNQRFSPPGQAPMQQPLPFQGPNPMQNAIFQNRRFMFQNGQMPVPMQQNMIGQFPMQGPPLPFPQNSLMRRPPPMRPPFFRGQRGGFPPGFPGRRFGNF